MGLALTYGQHKHLNSGGNEIAHQKADKRFLMAVAHAALFHDV
jgi:hypothetical protein